jgi:hypothetical protein
MPPALVPLALVAVGIPAACRALLGRPRSLRAGWVAAGAAVLLGQAAGELTGLTVGLLGEAQLLLASVGALLASALVAAAERRAVG